MSLDELKGILEQLVEMIDEKLQDPFITTKEFAMYEEMKMLLMEAINSDDPEEVAEILSELGLGDKDEILHELKEDSDKDSQNAIKIRQAIEKKMKDREQLNEILLNLQLLVKQNLNKQVEMQQQHQCEVKNSVMNMNIEDEISDTINDVLEEATREGKSIEQQAVNLADKVEEIAKKSFHEFMEDVIKQGPKPPGLSFGR